MSESVKIIFALLSFLLPVTVEYEGKQLSRNCNRQIFLTSQMDQAIAQSMPHPVQNSRWPQTPLQLGQVSGVAIDRHNNVIAFHRANRIWQSDSFDGENRYTKTSDGPIKQNTILILDMKTGEIKSSRGANKFYLPHGITVDDEGNLWVTDVALHQVFKLGPNSDEPLLTLGVAFHPGSDKQHFCKPTDVAVASNGEFYVSDGYCNSRIIKYLSDGSYQTEWGHSSRGNTFLVPHSLALSEKHSMICVADREHERILCYSAGLNGETPGNLVLCPIEGSDIGKVFAINIHDDLLFAVTGQTRDMEPKGLTIHLAEHSVGRNAEHLRPWSLLEVWQPAKGFGQVHDVAVCPSGRTIVTGEIDPNRIIKFVMIK